jgi:hypothetical protein
LEGWRFFSFSRDWIQSPVFFKVVRFDYSGSIFTAVPVAALSDVKSLAGRLGFRVVFSEKTEEQTRVVLERV